MRRQPSIPPMRALTISVVCFVLGLICMALIFGGCAPTLASKGIQVGVVAAQVADVHSTHLAIASGAGREGNPLMPESWWAQGLVKAATTAGIVWLGTTLEVKGHRTLARVLQASSAALVAVAAAHNYRLAHR